MINQAAHIPDAVLEEQRQAWLAGRYTDVDDLLLGSDFQHDQDARLDLVYNEIVIKEELGLNPTLEDYLQRFPELEQDLKLHFEVHRALDQQLLWDTADPHAEKSWPHPGAAVSPGGLPRDSYDILRVIGQGAMAVVYEARHRRLHRNVALKIFRPGRILTSRELFRIRTEAEAIARLTHPNIIQIFEVGESDGAPFLALELAEGGTLAKRLQQSSFTPQAAADLIETLARALHHAHDRRVIHRDLKPANILFAKDGTPKITDFGLAKVLEERDALSVDVTRTGEAMGTPRYMAPEQAAGKNDCVGPATDVYALGTLLYECLTGRAPFVSASVVETLQKIRDDDPLPPRRLQLSIPRDLETICLHCLEKDPSRRYATPLELAEDLQRFRRYEPIRIRPTPLWELGWKWCRKKPAHAALIALAIVMSVSSMLAAVALTQRERSRITGLRQSVAQLMKDGRAALDHDEFETAQARFQEAWVKVQAEPALSDHETSVTGWLDHSRNALNRYHWKQRVPPRDYDDRRDEALLLSLLLVPHLSNPEESARDAIRTAFELTQQNDYAWQLEREQLLLLDAEMIARESGPQDAFALLDGTNEFNSRRFHLQRMAYLTQLRRGPEAEKAIAEAEQFPPQAVADRFHSGMNLLRNRRFSQALGEFEAVLADEPEHFTARLFQSLCFLHLDRPGEAKVALTACVAQRPRFHWNYLFRSQTHLAAGHTKAAILDLRAALTGHPSETLRMVALMELGSAHWRQQQGVEALGAFVEITDRFPNKPAGWIMRASTEFLMGDLTQAARHYKEALELNEDLPGAHLGRALICLANEEFPSAKQDLQTALNTVFHFARDVAPASSPTTQADAATHRDNP